MKREPGGPVVDWWIKLLHRLDWCDLALQDVEGAIAILEAYA